MLPPGLMCGSAVEDCPPPETSRVGARNKGVKKSNEKIIVCNMFVRNARDKRHGNWRFVIRAHSCSNCPGKFIKTGFGRNTFNKKRRVGG